MRRSVMPLLVMIAVATLAACSSGTTSPSHGSVAVLLTDAPIDLTGVKAVNVTLKDMILFPPQQTGDSGGAPMTLQNVVSGAGLTVNLLDYQNGKTVVVAAADVPPGTYSRIRMEIESAELVRAGATAEDPDQIDPIYVPSGKVDVPVTFTVTASTETDVTLDFDAAMSVQVNSTPGQQAYILRPVITPVGTSQK